MDFRFGRFEIRPTQRQLLVDGNPVKLGARAFDILLALVERRDRTVGKNELLDLVWPGLVVEENNLPVQISTLRRLLGSACITTIPGRGYRFTPTEQHVDDLSVAVPPASGSTVDRSRGLFASTTPLFGRDDELAALGVLLSQNRLITVTGAGGVGKSRLAHRLALTKQKDFADGVFWVELAGVEDPASVPNAIAAALGLTIGDVDPCDELVARASKLDALIAIDNAEHVATEVARIVHALLRESLRVRILVTSQVSLRVAGERVFRLGTLAVPEPDAPAEEAATFGAIQLFVERARAAERLFELREDNVSTVISICRQLDGVPLALELAAARVPSLSVAQLEHSLGQRLRLLNSGRSSAPGRQQTLRAAMEWSHGLLTPHEQMLFRRIGVFLDGFSLELAQGVASGDGIDEWDVLDLLDRLVDRSLVVVRGTDAPRYRLLETTRSYSLERLTESGETEIVLRRRTSALQGYLATLRCRYWTLSAADYAQAGSEIENLRAALEWSVSRKNERHLAYLLLGVSRVTWHASGRLFEGIERCRQLMPMPEDTPLEIQARVYEVYGGLGYLTSREDCYIAAQQAARLFRELGDADGLALALLTIAMIGSRRGRAKEVATALSEADVVVGKDSPARCRAALALSQALWHTMCGREEQALAAYFRQATCYRESKDSFRLQLAYCNAAMPEARLGQYESAIHRLQTGLAELRSMRAPHGIGQALGYLAFALALRNAPGDLEQAQAHARFAWSELRGERHSEWLIPAIAFAFARNGRSEDASRLIGYSDSVWSSEGFAARPSDSKVRDQTLNLSHGVLGAQRTADLMAEGAALNEDQAVALAFGIGR